MNFKQKEISFIDNKDMLKNKLLNDYGYNIYSKRINNEDFSKVYHFKNRTKINKTS